MNTTKGEYDYFSNSEKEFHFNLTLNSHYFIHLKFLIMKQFLIATNLILLAVAIFFCYKFFDIKNVKAEEKPILETGKDKCSSKICHDYTGAEWHGRITGSQAELLKRIYRSSAGKNVIWNGEARTGIEDSKAAWFPLDVIKRYIWQIEAENCSNNCSDSLGLKVYYGKYPAVTDPSWSQFGIPDSYASHHTIFFVPTFWNGKEHIDFDPWAGCRKRINVKDSVGLPPNPAILLIGTGDDEAQNHGGLIPPGIPAGG